IRRLGESSLPGRWWKSHPEVLSCWLGSRSRWFLGCGRFCPVRSGSRKGLSGVSAGKRLIFPEPIASSGPALFISVCAPLIASWVRPRFTRATTALRGGSQAVRLTVIGTGYVGLTMGVVAAYLGYDVVCVDKDLRKLQLLNEGRSPIREPGLDALLSHVRGRMKFSADTPRAVRDAD